MCAQHTQDAQPCACLDGLKDPLDAGVRLRRLALLQLLAEGELTPGIQASEYAQRRERLCRALPPGSVVVLQAANPQYMAGIIPYPYRQDPDFFYLTGINQIAVAVIQTDPSPQGGTQHRYTLFVEPPNSEKARWEGERLDLEAAKTVFGAHEAYYTTQLRRRLLDALIHAPLVLHPTSSLAHSKDVAWALSEALLAPSGPSPTTPSPPSPASTSPAPAPEKGMGGGHSADAPPSAVAGAAGRQPISAVPLTAALHAMRVRKSAAEVRLMRASADASAQALRKCMAMTRPGVWERSLGVTFEYECKMKGASRLSFPPIVASGVDACTIHYLRMDKVLREGSLVLMDAGCELHGYCSDVTRTWPVNGRFSPPQRDVYEAVLDTHARCIEACKPGTSSIRSLHQLSVRLTCEALKDLRLVPQGISIEAVEARHLNTFYWHSVGHLLGLDTHDSASMGFDKPLQPGQCLTIEPGLYIPDHEPHFGALRGVGVRIEDDVVVTEQGCEVLSAAAPVAIGELEEQLRK
ncbi:peptidase M24, structural domain-containing protein [Dunaliella salina]|uniref:Peptidase M24, structural domain-containing protein n=1 Tax=Dunaliella salina TaxID=3046 RepID=A0ABQ7GNW1_DUNSA|nr:peptidase M24, structural domain-containing protein [Dunaliella salina]|eukprot:KAF5836291.1 peptidase M24, structural domain-containing protein [Dunaliella salina]